MSGIVGTYYLDGRTAERADLEHMMATLAHRGPDGAGLWNEGPVGMGHLMLRTTPESLHEQLPLLNRFGNAVITADARIDNRDELISRLHLVDRPPSEIADSELILASYERWGVACPRELLGDFAFAIWDARRQQLFCARDPVGMKPLFYYHSGHVYVFASELRAILCLPEVPRQLNEVRVADHIAWLFEDQAITFYRDIFQLPAAHTMIVGPNGARMHRYWSLDPSRALRLSSDEEYVEAFREIFTNAVRNRLRSAFPVGSMLSGGLDSSSIVCTARNMLPAESNRRLHTFSAIWSSLRDSHPRSDEQRYIDAVVAMGGIEPHYVHADRCSPLGEFLWQADEPTPAPNFYMDRAVFEAAQLQGVRVLLSGFDGDTVVSHGYEYLEELARTGRWLRLRSEAAALAKTTFRSSSARRIMWRFGFRPLVPEPARHIWRVLRRHEPPIEAWRAFRGRPRLEWDIPPAINPEFARRVGLDDRAREQQIGASGARAPREAHLLGLQSGLLFYALRCLEQGAAAFALELRCPFRDRRLMEFCLALPPAQKLRHGWPRAILRRAMAGILPPDVQWRSGKGNIGTHFKRGMLADHRETLEDVIMRQPQIIAEYMDLPTLRAAYRRYAAAPVAAEKDALVVLAGVTLAKWLRGKDLCSRPQVSERRLESNARGSVLSTLAAERG